MKQPTILGGIASHPYIALIEYTLRNPEYSIDEVCTAVGMTEKQFRFVMDRLFAQSGLSSAEHRSHTEYEWILSPEAYFAYLQYREFRHAVETSRTSLWVAIAALIVATLGTIASFVAPFLANA